MNFLKYVLRVGGHRTFYSYCEQDKHDYYKALNFISNSKQLIQKLSSFSDGQKLFEISNQIKPYDLCFGSDMNQAIHLLGKPNYIFLNENIQNHTVLFYKRKVNQYKNLIQLHYFYNELIFAVSHIYEPFVFESAHIKDLNNLILTKYNLSINEKELMNSFSVLDSNDNQITVSNSLGYTVCYSTGDSFIISRISEQLQQNRNVHAKLSLMNRVALMNFL